MLRTTAILAAAIAVGAIGPTTAARAEFNFVALGDMPYGAPEEAYPPYETLIETVNALNPAFVVHIGDTKSGSTACDDRELAQQKTYLDTFSPAALYTPGDNEWTDCHREAAGGFDPLERLAHLRETYFADPGTSFGTDPVAVESQAAVMAEHAGYPENVRMSRDGVMVVLAHVVGSNNNFQVRDRDAAMEFFARDAASTAWLEASFDKAIADGNAAVVLAIHADMFEDGFADEEWAGQSGFAGFGEALKAKAAAFGKPVLLIFGDSHRLQIFRPFPEAAGNVMALEVFGADHMHAVEVSVDPEVPGVFGFRPVLNPDIEIAG